jgi:cysteine desulfurase / selenocysteine lyase
MEVREARRLFPGTADAVFLDAACVSVAPSTAVEAVADFARSVAVCAERDASAAHVAMDRRRDRAVVEGARLLGADVRDVALVESTTHGLNIAAQSIPFDPGDNVVISDLEFLQVAIPWVKLRERGTIAEVRLARNLGGALPVEAFARVIDERTRAVVVSSVQWSNGYRVDLAGLGRLCRECGAYLVVDAIQQLGAVELDVRETPVDLLVAGGHKWLNSPFGCGLLYIDVGALATLRQPSWGYLGLESPEGGWPRYFSAPSTSPLRDYEFPAAAKSFEIGGTANYPGAVALGASLALVNELGIDRVGSHVLALAGRLQEELRRYGVRVVTPPEPETRSGITTFLVSDERAENERLLASLLDERILVSIRYMSGVGGIRVSTHYYNDEKDLDMLLEALRRLLRRRRPKRYSPQRDLVA